VLAHEIGHHVQKVTGIEERVRRTQRSRPRDANALSLRMEPQADCCAGVWAHSTARRDLLEVGDVEEGLEAASRAFAAASDAESAASCADGSGL